jgi:hypothetical protein
MKLFTLQVANGFQFLLHPEDEKILELYGSMTYKPLLAGWKMADAQFVDVEKKHRPPPDICLFSLGCLMVPAGLKKAIFPEEPEDIEFLPISVSGEPWLIANCLRTTRLYDPSKSILYRSAEDEKIFMVVRVVINDASLEQCEMFTIDDSNRTQIFVQPSFVDRVNALGFKGVNFKEIGSLNSHEA